MLYKSNYLFQYFHGFCLLTHAIYTVDKYNCDTSINTFVLYTVTLYTVQCTLYDVHYTLYNVHCMMYNAHVTRYTSAYSVYR